MREKIDTIPLHEAFQSGDECPFCYLERKAEQRAIDYTIGPCASYMEPEIRALTDAEGFCGSHLKKMHDYTNALGNALILQTYYVGLLRELEQQMEDFTLPPKKGLLRRKGTEQPSDLVEWMARRQSSCFVCRQVEESMERYYRTFFAMLREEEFRIAVEQSKGFCMRHFRQLMEKAAEDLPNSQREWFYPAAFTLMRENLSRVKADLDWFVAKNDYRNAGLDWNNSRDAVPRAMQKLQGGHPADPVFKNSDYGTRKV